MHNLSVQQLLEIKDDIRRHNFRKYAEIIVNQSKAFLKLFVLKFFDSKKEKTRIFERWNRIQHKRALDGNYALVSLLRKHGAINELFFIEFLKVLNASKNSMKITAKDYTIGD